eukprot:TRINITY_DN10509_c0_g1_i1.p1 TRINITY_DN10509_c0_g1~~TRINITY_DN10509_c0_g1_i1.p1  ORF type:complete len:815 (+),score=213.80 TRINITY_DN10509_c0_g1_i1:75-2519(+)
MTLAPPPHWGGEVPSEEADDDEACPTQLWVDVNEAPTSPPSQQVFPSSRLLSAREFIATITAAEAARHQALLTPDGGLAGADGGGGAGEGGGGGRRKARGAARQKGAGRKGPPRGPPLSAARQLRAFSAAGRSRPKGPAPPPQAPAEEGEWLRRWQLAAGTADGPRLRRALAQAAAAAHSLLCTAPPAWGERAPAQGRPAAPPPARHRAPDAHRPRRAPDPGGPAPPPWSGLAPPGRATRVVRPFGVVSQGCRVGAAGAPAPGAVPPGTLVRSMLREEDEVARSQAVAVCPPRTHPPHAVSRCLARELWGLPQLVPLLRRAVRASALRARKRLAAALIGRWWRLCVRRRRQRRACGLLCRCARGRMGRRLMRRRWRCRAATAVQRIVRGAAARVRLHLLQGAAVTLQQCFRASASRRAVAEALLRRGCMRLLQGWRLRCIRRRHTAAARLQGAGRALSGRRRCARLLLAWLVRAAASSCAAALAWRRAAAALRLQRAQRCRAARAELRARRRAVAAALRIQCAWRVLVAGRRAGRRRAASRVQVELYLLRQGQREQLRAALALQLAWRRHWARRRLAAARRSRDAELESLQLAEAAAAAAAVQRAWRCRAARRRVAGRRALLARMRLVRCFARWCQLRIRARRTASARFVLSEWRGVVRIRFAREQAARLRLQRRQVEARKDAEENAAMIQAVWRGWRARHWAVPVIVARRVQRAQRDAAEEREQAAVAIQCAFRMHLGRLLGIRLSRLRAHCAAAKLQALWRGRQDRHAAASLIIQRNRRFAWATLRIQTLWRCCQEVRAAQRAVSMLRTPDA